MSEIKNKYILTAIMIILSFIGYGLTSYMAFGFNFHIIMIIITCIYINYQLLSLYKGAKK
jgi:hypothetical protein